MKSFWSQLLPVVSNKYVLSLLLFFLWIAFFDSNRLSHLTARMKDLHELEAQKAYYEQKIGEDRRKLLELQSSPENLEKFAREQFYMKRPNEDIFIIED